MTLALFSTRLHLDSGCPWDRPRSPYGTSLIHSKYLVTGRGAVTLKPHTFGWKATPPPTPLAKCQLQIDRLLALDCKSLLFEYL